MRKPQEKQWVQPELKILKRQDMRERVLGYCKSGVYGGGSGPGDAYCWLYGGTTPCSQQFPTTS